MSKKMTSRKSLSRKVSSKSKFVARSYVTRLQRDYGKAVDTINNLSQRLQQAEMDFEGRKDSEEAAIIELNVRIGEIERLKEEIISQGDTIKRLSTELDNRHFEIVRLKTQLPAIHREVPYQRTDAYSRVRI